MKKSKKSGRSTYQYSEAFRQKVVMEIEKGEINMSQARKKYDIRGAATIPNWIKKMGKNHLLGKKIRIVMPNEVEKVRQLEKQIQELKEVMINLQVEKFSLESYLKLACKDLGTDAESYKKKLGSNVDKNAKR